MAKQSDANVQPSAESVERFRRSLDPLAKAGSRLGLAVSGGPDSLAMLVLAATARPGEIQAATVDHGLRPEARQEAEMVAALCERLGIPHQILTAEWDEKPETGLQEKARGARYRLLGEWAKGSGVNAILVAHHVDDQAETFLMRLARGAGVKGLAAMRRLTVPPGGKIAVLRPLLGWRRSELEQVCAEAALSPVDDPSNDDDQFERVRIRKALGDAAWLDPASIARSANNLAQADAALHWAATQEWQRSVTNGGDALVYTPGKAPAEIRRRIARRAVLALATEGRGMDLRGRELDTLLTVLMRGRQATLRGVMASGGEKWRFSRAPQRQASAKQGQAAPQQS